MRNLGISVLINLLALVTAMVANRFLSNVKHCKHLIDVFVLQYVTLAFKSTCTDNATTN